VTRIAGLGCDDVPYSHLATDLARNQLPRFSFITPNLIDDMHNGTVADGNRWLSRNLPVILNSAE
jgi:acid phosphatase